MIGRFVAVPRWLLLGTLVYAPWAYGCTEDWAIDILDLLMFLITVLWLLGCVVRRKLPVLNRLCLACVCIVLAQGWLVALNAQYSCNQQTLEFSPIESFWKSGPGTVDQLLSLPAIFKFTGLLGVLCFVIDLSQLPLWRKRLWWTIAGTGVSIVLFGLLERFTQAPMIFWQTPPDRWPWPFFFATYYYHANAGAFINLILPLVAGLAIISFCKTDAHKERTIWGPALFLCIAGAFVNVSKAAMALTVLLMVILGVWQFREWRMGHAASISRKVLIIYACLAVVGLFAVACAGWVVAGPRWLAMAGDLTRKNERLLVEGACLRIIPEAGCWGFGPGTFSHVFPHYTSYLGDAIAGFWKYAHEDYLQTFIEWGWIGASILGFIFLGGIVIGFRRFLKMTWLSSRDRIFLFTTCVALTGVALHALVDFPLQIASLQLYTAVYLGIAWGSGQWKAS